MKWLGKYAVIIGTIVGVGWTLTHPPIWHPTFKIEVDEDPR